MKVYIEGIELSKYRSCKKTYIALNQNLSALIGANGSGKTNILNGLLLLKKLIRASGRRHDDGAILSGCKVKASFNIGGKTARYEALIKYTTNERNVDEVVGANEKWNFKDITKRDEWLSIPLSLPNSVYRFGGIDPSELPIRERKYFMTEYNFFYEINLIKKAHWKAITPVLETVFDFIMGTNYYSASRFTDPSRCPVSFELENERLSRRLPRYGEEHIQFMYDLYDAYKNNKAEFNEFISVVGNDGVGLVDGIEYDELDIPSSVYQVASGGRVIQREVKKLLVIPSVITNGTKLSPNQLSEGTFKTLAILFYIITDKSRLLLLEEPEVCIHHGLLASILEIIKAFSRRKQIIISTHSDFVLDAIEPTNVFIVRNDPGKGTVVKHVPSAMSSREYRTLKEYLDNVGNLGEYWRHGELEK